MPEEELLDARPRLNGPIGPLPMSGVHFSLTSTSSLLPRASLPSTASVYHDAPASNV